MMNAFLNERGINETYHNTIISHFNSAYMSNNCFITVLKQLHNCLITDI